MLGGAAICGKLWLARLNGCTQHQPHFRAFGQQVGQAIAVQHGHEGAQASGEQPKRLAGAILAFARNVDRLEALGPAIESIAARHVAAHIKPEHYPAVAAALLPAIADVLGEAATPAVLEAWGQAYWFLAEVLMGREREIYAA
jgi:hemoglobin-like flavoprotein